MIFRNKLHLIFASDVNTRMVILEVVSKKKRRILEIFGGSNNFKNIMKKLLIL